MFGESADHPRREFPGNALLVTSIVQMYIRLRLYRYCDPKKESASGEAEPNPGRIV